MSNRSIPVHVLHTKRDSELLQGDPAKTHSLEQISFPLRCKYKSLTVDLTAAHLARARKWASSTGVITEYRREFEYSPFIVPQPLTNSPHPPPSDILFPNQEAVNALVTLLDTRVPMGGVVAQWLRAPPSKRRVFNSILATGVSTNEFELKANYTVYSVPRRQIDEDMHHVLRSCLLYDDIIKSDFEVLQTGPVYYANFIISSVLRRTSAGSENLRVLGTDCAGD
ncbi:hypothetical protein EVAR_62892_1 [Eumeta japonica]|uniref:Uncharacterized protein n=1 Tax=Eumeta variegata TaxID=151549 RepID=A0A4C1YAV0_EUMVA|nr:hypothetical protein EVAR_62892_1 [Eumeta japonica]